MEHSELFSPAIVAKKFWEAYGQEEGEWAMEFGITSKSKGEEKLVEMGIRAGLES